MSGRDVAGIFMELPDRKLFADYYKTISDPISLQSIEVSGFTNLVRPPADSA